MVITVPELRSSAEKSCVPFPLAGDGLRSELLVILKLDGRVMEILSFGDAYSINSFFLLAMLVVVVVVDVPSASSWMAQAAEQPPEEASMEVLPAIMPTMLRILSRRCRLVQPSKPYSSSSNEEEATAELIFGFTTLAIRGRRSREATVVVVVVVVGGGERNLLVIRNAVVVVMLLEWNRVTIPNNRFLCRDTIVKIRKVEW